MKSVTPEGLAAALSSLGVAEGDILLVHSDVSRIGPVRGAATREETLDGFLGGLRLAVGQAGTLAALACTENLAREGGSFVCEESPSTQGVLSEHLRTRPGALRSLHPVFSVCALGPRAVEVIGDDPTGFGRNSPFGRLLAMEAKILCLGVDLQAMTFVHHAEQAWGVPYGYTKEWDIPVIREGRRVDRRFFAFVRYLGVGVDYDFTRLQDRLFARGLARKAPVGYGYAHLATCRDVFDTAQAGLAEDVFFLLRHPPQAEPWKGKTMPGLDHERK